MTSTAYTVRVSPRAKRVTLRISLDAGLVVVVPRRFDHSAVPAIVREKAAWIARHEARLSAERALLEADPPTRLPQGILLPAVGEEWRVDYHPTAARGVTARENAGGLVRVSGDVGDAAACRAALGRWLIRRAQDRLVPWLEALSRRHDLPFTKVTVRAQSTRWGSCSRHGAISLNRGLLFLPPELAEYVMLHELCHTVRLDHSRVFWTELRRREPDCDRLRKEMRGARLLVPGWARVGRD